MKKKLLLQSLSLVIIMSMFAGCGKEAKTPVDSAAAPAASTAASTAAVVTEAPATEAPATAAPSTVKGKITFLNHRTDIAETKMKEYIAAFKVLYPEADVENQAVANQTDVLKVRAAANELADVSFVGGDAMKNVDYPKFFLPIDDLGFAGKVLFESQNIIDGKLYAVSSGGSITGVLYNKKAYAAAGITKTPVTLDEFYAACELLKAKGIVPVATNYFAKWPLDQYAALAYSIADDVALKDKNAKIDAPYTMDSPYGKALEILRTLADKKYTEKDLFSTDWETSKKDLASGKFAMAVLGNWAVPQIIESGSTSEDIGFFPMPVDNSGKLVSPIGSDAFIAISKNSKNIDTAKAFVKFFVEQSGYDNDSGFVPALKATKSTVPQIADFMAANPKLLETGPTLEYTNKVSNKAQFAFPDFAQEYMVEPDKQKVLDRWNKKWADARKVVTE
ncbi:extracellular solute-binding protein [Paenibacillus psychroresistens]|uniref:Extracellular solute-binding protein n=1 Tax=Paenibacillus psychroresistens TaxID=1778678 RepID=A0A6B8RE91_9BACL|nr:extracellular solute-binding protein [Paenibacillus psychroresistens]QGQ94791.1 extracellular solute-binding protein [Paenibacillus psychroresistens]